jgi:hypothetical protein
VDPETWQKFQCPTARLHVLPRHHRERMTRVDTCGIADAQDLSVATAPYERMLTAQHREQAWCDGGARGAARLNTMEQLIEQLVEQVIEQLVERETLSRRLRDGVSTKRRTRHDAQEARSADRGGGCSRTSRT